jgi:hypothetical protein
VTAATPVVRGSTVWASSLSVNEREASGVGKRRR